MVGINSQVFCLVTFQDFIYLYDIERPGFAKPANANGFRNNYLGSHEKP